MTCGGPMGGDSEWQQQCVDVPAEPGSRVEEGCEQRGLDRRSHSSLPTRTVSGSSCTYSISLKPTPSEFWSTWPRSQKSHESSKDLNKEVHEGQETENRETNGQLFASILSRHFVYNHSTGCRPRAVALNSSDRFLPDTHLCRRRSRPPSRPTMASLKQI